MKLVTRAQWGARDYRLPGGATLYSGSRRGVKLHYLGTAYSDRPHMQCAAYVRQIQAQHMDGNGWSDVGYSFLVCTHGYVYEGRGLRRRNSANGNTTLNNQDYAVLLLVGSSGLTEPTDEQLHGARDAIDYCRSEGPAGVWLGGHRDGYATSCPGDAVYAWAKAGAPRPTTSEDTDMPISDADADRIARRVLTMDGVIKNPSGAADNTHIALATAVQNLDIIARRSEGKLAAQGAAIAELSRTVAALAANSGSIDPDALVARIEQAIESIDVRLEATSS
jgi:hypothetical protein